MRVDLNEIKQIGYMNTISMFAKQTSGILSDAYNRCKGIDIEYKFIRFKYDE